jgi:DNA-directed RNA polymerase specialized sigma24 family protein
MELMPFVLKVLADGGLYSKKGIDKAAMAEFGVTESEMKEKISCGANKFKNRTGWALINLKNKGLIIKEGKEYHITETGTRAVNAAPNRLTAKFVKSLGKSSDDGPGGMPGGGAGNEPPQVGQPSVIQGPAGEPSAEGIEDPNPEIEQAETENAPSIDLSLYAGIDPESEFMQAVRAKVGDKGAFKKLWDKYRPMMVGMFRFCKNLTIDDRASEAALVFVHKLEKFMPEKIGSISPESWSFSYMLTGGVKNARDKIIRHSEKDTEHYLFGFKEEAQDETGLPYYTGNAFPIALDVNKYDYEEKYSPEIYAVRAADVSLEDKEKALMGKLSPLQIAILRLRQAGKTIQEIADEMGCGFTKVRLNIVRARELASSVFDVNYG